MVSNSRAIMYHMRISDSDSDSDDYICCDGLQLIQLCGYSVGDSHCKDVANGYCKRCYCNLFRIFNFIDSFRCVNLFMVSLRRIVMHNLRFTFSVTYNYYNIHCGWYRFERMY